MKKILLATTAVVALTTISAEAFAADKIKLSLGGFMRQYVALTNHDDIAPAANSAVARAVDLGQDANSEIYFRGSTKLDNGLSVAVDIQQESSTRNANGDTARKFDVVSLQVSSDAMGAFTIGSTATAADGFLTRAPMPVGSYDWADTDAFASTSTTATAASATFASASTSDITGSGGKGLKLKYVSPNFSGVNVYASYAAANTDDRIQAASNASSDEYTYGVAFGGEVGGASVAADLTHMNLGGNVETNHIGASVGMAGFTVAGGYSDFNEQRSTALLGTTVASEDGNAWELGVGYATGPYSVSAVYMAAKNTGSTANAGDSKDKKWQIGATYDLGAGVALSGMYWSSKATTDTAATTDDFKVSGVIAGIEVGF